MCSHCAITHNPWVWRALQLLSESVLGISSYCWKHEVRARWLHSALAVFRNNFMRDIVAIYMYAQKLITSRVPINKSIRPRDEVIMMNNDETYDEIMM